VTNAVTFNNNNNIYLTATRLSPGGIGFKHIYKYLTLSTEIYIYIGGGGGPTQEERREMLDI
jgi:hypothetical protein